MDQNFLDLTFLVGFDIFMTEIGLKEPISYNFLVKHTSELY